MEGLVDDAEQALSQMVFTVTSNSDDQNLGAEFSRSTLQLTTLTEDYFSLSPIILTLTVNDGEYEVETTMNVYIDPVNDPPILAEIDDQETFEDTPLVLTLEATDVDEDLLTFTALSEYPDNVSVDVEGDQLTLTPAQDFYGDVQISVSVTDGEYTPPNTVFILTVLPVNDTPTIELPESFTFDEDESFVEDFSPYLSDIDEDDLTLTVEGQLNVTVEINTFFVTFSAEQDWNGTETLTFTVNDSQGRAIASDDVDVVVIPVNDAPILTEIGNQETSEEISLVLTLEATDVDEDDLIFSAVSEHPEDVVAEVTGNQLTLSPAQDWYGIVNIFVTVSDGDLWDLENFELTVNPVNDAPVITDQVELFTIEETPITIIFSDLVVEDVDNDYPEGFTLTVSDSGDYSEFYSVDIDDATIIPGLDFNGIMMVPVYVDDGENEYSQSDVFDLELNVTNLNDPPILGFIGNQVTNEDTALIINLSATDVDTDSTDLTFSASSDNENVFVSLEGNQLTMVPTLDFNGSVNITAEVTDGEFTDSETFVLTVHSINDPPELGFIGPQETMEDTDLILILTATDVDNTELYFEVSSDTTGVNVIVDGNQLTIEQISPYSIPNTVEGIIKFSRKKFLVIFFYMLKKKNSTIFFEKNCRLNI